MTNDSKEMNAVAEQLFPQLSGIADEETGEYAAGEQAQEQAEQKEAQAEQESNADGWLEAVTHAREMICAVLPEAEPVWNKARMENLAGALSRCDEAYGWGGVGQLFTHPLIGLAFASFPLVIGTGRVIAVAKARRQVDVQANVVEPVDKMAAAASSDSGPAV